jgi:hypothetical protein
MDKVTYNGQIRNGSLHIIHRSKFDQFIAGCGWNQVEIIIRKKKKKRSLSQSAYLFGVVYHVVQEGIEDLWGESISKEDIHLMLKMKFLYREIIDPSTGEITRLPKSTADISTSEMMGYIAEIGGWARDYLNIELPEPNTQQEMF